MTKRPSLMPALGEPGRRPSPTLPEIVSLLEGAPPIREPQRPARSERVAVVARNAAGVLGHLAPDRRSFVEVYRVIDDVPPTDEALVVLIAEDTESRDGDGPLRRLRGRAPFAKFVFLSGARDEEKSRALAAWGAVLPPSADAERLERALRHASALSTMAAEMRRLKESGQFRAPSSPPPGSEGS